MYRRDPNFLSKLRELTSAGWTQAKISLKLGCHKNTIARYQKNLGISPVGISPKTEMKILGLLRTGKTQRAICAQLGVGSFHVQEIAKANAFRKRKRKQMLRRMESLEMTNAFVELVQKFSLIWYGGAIPKLPADRAAFIARLLECYMPESLRELSSLTTREWLRERETCAFAITTAVDCVVRQRESAWTN